MGLSRNKVAVPEGAAGSPPFYGDSGRGFSRPVSPPVRMVRCPVGCWCGRDHGGSCGMGMLLGSRIATGPSGLARSPYRVPSLRVRGWVSVPGRGGGLRTGEWTRARILCSCLLFFRTNSIVRVLFFCSDRFCDHECEDLLSGVCWLLSRAPCVGCP